MLRTTNKQVVQGLINHVTENFMSENYGNDQPVMVNLRDQIGAMTLNNPTRSIYQACIDYVEGGSLLISYYDQRKFLQDLLQETDAEANKYDDDRVFRLYCHLCARTLSNLYGKEF